MGIDPGTSGAFAVLDQEQAVIALDDMPVAGGVVDAVNFAEQVALLQPTGAFLEFAASRPGQGVRSVFKFGQSYGRVIGVLAALQVPMFIVTPFSWKKQFNLQGKPKDAARELAIRLFPSTGNRMTRMKDHGRADALMIAAYGYHMARTG